MQRLKKAICLFLGICVFLIYMPVYKNVYGEVIFFEAEDYTVSGGYNTNGVITVVDSDTSQVKINTARGNKYIQIFTKKGEIRTNIDKADREYTQNDYAPIITYSIANRTDNAALLVRATAASEGNDSFFCSIDDGAYVSYGTTSDLEWGWTLITNTLSAGEHIINILPRESGCMIDCFCISSSYETAPILDEYDSDGSYIGGSVQPIGDWRNIHEQDYDFVTGVKEGYTFEQQNILMSSLYPDEAESFIQTAKSLLPGQELVVKNGTYDYSGVMVSEKAGRLINIKDLNGTEDAPIRIRAESPGGVHLKGDVGIKLENCQYVEFSGFFFDGLLYDKTDTSITWNVSSAFILAGCNNCRVTQNYFLSCGRINGPYDHIFNIRGASQRNRVDHNTFDDPYSMQLGITGATSGKDARNKYNILDHNYFVNVEKVTTRHNTTVCNGMESIQIGQGGYLTSFNTLAEWNRFENVIGDGAEIISSKISQNWFRNNSFVANNSGPTFRSAHGCIFENNYFKNNSSGLRLYGQNHLVRNNYYEDVTGSVVNVLRGDTGGGVYREPYNIIIEGNVIINGGPLRLDASDNAPIHEEGRIEYPSHDMTVKDNILASSRGVMFFQSKYNYNITYSGNRAYMFSGASTTVRDDGISYGIADEQIINELKSKKTVEIKTYKNRANAYDDYAGTSWDNAIISNSIACNNPVNRVSKSYYNLSDTILSQEPIMPTYTILNNSAKHDYYIEEVKRQNDIISIGTSAFSGAESADMYVSFYSGKVLVGTKRIGITKSRIIEVDTSDIGDFEYAKVFVWKKGTLKPLTSIKEIDFIQ